jgi:predicted nuclease of restriction endonuclease-like (RecB) superfamily
MNTIPVNDPEYVACLNEMKARVARGRIAAASAVNTELILMYWHMGQAIAHRQERLGWGRAVIERLARDLQDAFPGARGFSPRNLWEMRRFFTEHSRDQILQQLVAELPATSVGSVSTLAHSAAAVVADECGSDVSGSLLAFLAGISWGHHLLILNSVKDPTARFFYIKQSARCGWSRVILDHQIKAQCYERSLKLPKSHNFGKVLPEELAASADEVLKDSYDLAFAGVDNLVRERELEGRCITKVQRFMLELGYGFCFIGRQHRITLGDNEYFLDLLFYHRFLRALVAVEIKLKPFQPEFAGKMDFYLNVLNDTQRASEDNPSIGIVLCASKDDLVVEYSLKTKGNPIGVATYQLTPDLPTNMRGKLPSQSELRAVVRSELESAEASQLPSVTMERRIGNRTKGSRRTSVTKP